MAPPFPGPGTTVPAYGKVTTPGALGSIVQCPDSAVTGALYRLDIVFYIDGTPAAATDEDNIQIVGTSPVNGIQLAYPILTVPFVLQQTIFTASNGVGAAQFQVRAIAAATAGAVYHCYLGVTPIGPPYGLGSV